MDNKIFISHFGIKDSIPWGPKFINFVFVIQEAFVPNFKSVAQIVFEIRTMKYFGGHLKIEDSSPGVQKFIIFFFVIQGVSAPNLKSVAQIVSAIHGPYWCRWVVKHHLLIPLIKG